MISYDTIPRLFSVNFTGSPMTLPKTLILLFFFILGQNSFASDSSDPSDPSPPSNPSKNSHHSLYCHCKECDARACIEEKENPITYIFCPRCLKESWAVGAEDLFTLCHHCDAKEEKKGKQKQKKRPPRSKKSFRPSKQPPHKRAHSEEKKR